MEYTNKKFAKYFNYSQLLANISPDCLERLSWSHVQIFKVEDKLFREKKGSALLSCNLEFNKPEGNPIHLFKQVYLFYSSSPHNAVFAIQLFSNIDCCKIPKKTWHQYVGEDISLFRFPDEDLFKIRHPFSVREFEIIKLIGTGLNSKEIAEKLFLSVHTVNTHRCNALKKSSKAHISELIYDLQNDGLL